VPAAPGPDVEALRAALRRAEADTGARVVALQREFDEIVESGSLTNTDDEHDPDGATIAYERARTAALLARATEDLDHLRRSRTRLDAGDFGRCQTCGRPIGAERLLAHPTARHCIACAG
jgi:RNA polymerase-binding transcription factor DksA